MYKAFINTKSELKVYKDVEPSVKFAKELLKQEETLYKEDLLKIFDIDNNKISDLKIIYDEYYNLMNEKYFTNKNINIKDIIPNNHYIISNYYEFSYLEKEFINILLLNNYDIDFICNKDIYNKLSNKYEIEEINNDIKEKEYAYYYADDIANEVSFIENEIFKNIKEGYKLNDIAVITFNPNEYKEYFNIIFKDLIYNKNLENGYLVKKLIESIKYILDSNLSCDSFINYLKLGCSDYNKKDICMLDNYIYIWNLSDKSFNEEFTLNPNGKMEELKYYDNEKLKRLNNLRDEVYTPFNYLLENVEKENTKEILKYLYMYLEEEKVFEVLSKEDNKGLNKLLDIMDLISNNLNGLNFYEIISLMNDLLEIEENVINYTDEISIVDINNINFIDKKIIYFVGFSEDNTSLSYSDMNLLNKSDIKEYSNIRLNKYLNKYNKIIKDILDSDSKIYITFHKQSDDLKLLEESSLLNNLNIKKIKNEKIYSNSLLKNIYSKTKNKDIKKHINDDLIDKIDAASNYKLEKKLDTNIYSDELKISPSGIEMYSKCKFSYFCSYGLGLKLREKKTFDKREVGTFAHYLLEKIFKNDLDKINKDNIGEYINKHSNNYLEDNFGIKTNTLNYIVSNISNNIKLIINNILDELSLTKLEPKYFELKIKDKEDVKPLEIELKSGKLILGGIVDRVDIYETSDKVYYRIIDYKTGTKGFRLDDTLEGLNLQMLIYLLAIKESMNIGNKKLIPVGIEYYPVSLKTTAINRNLTEEDRLKEFQKNLVMNGYLSKEEEIISLFSDDSLSLYTDSYSKDKPNEEKTYTNKHIDLLFKKIKLLLEDIGNNIMNNDVSINPINSKRVVSCEYCNMRSICRFDDKIFKYRRIKDHKNKEIIEELEGDIND